MRVFITGGKGLVGHNVAEKLSLTYEVLAPSHSEVDLLDAEAVGDYILAKKPDIIIHCAGIVGGIQANIREPARFLVENFELGKNVIMAAAENRVSQLINLGSSCMYPRAAPNPLREDMVLKGELEPTNEGYAIAKISIQRLCAYLKRERPELSYKTLLPCNLYGKWDKFDPANSHMIPAVIRKIYEAKRDNRQLVEIWGSGKAKREFMYAADLADFIAYALDHFNMMPDLLNVGLGYDHTVDEYYETVARVIGFAGAFTHDVSKPEGMERKLVDISALEAFGWKAKTPLEEGICMTYKYFLEQEKVL
ncbi:MAG: GDP-L-fucose synthase [Nitrospirota bacterium]|nr:GDP-L-fucose synthase [Nitrospirota bacterium]